MVAVTMANRHLLEPTLCGQPHAGVGLTGARKYLVRRYRKVSIRRSKELQVPREFRKSIDAIDVPWLTERLPFVDSIHLPRRK